MYTLNNIFEIIKFKVDDKEIDLIANKRENKIYVQVCEKMPQIIEKITAISPKPLSESL